MSGKGKRNNYYRFGSLSTTFLRFLRGVLTTPTSGNGRVSDKGSLLMGVEVSRFLDFFFFFPVVSAVGQKFPASPPIVASLQALEEGQMLRFRQSPHLGRWGAQSV